jgi:hypothetical protein
MMARTKSLRKPQRAATADVKDPWDVEHELSLKVHGPTASTDLIYPSTVHRGFDSQFTAEPLTRRWPIFEESESHREFLVYNRSERLIIPGERDNYFTPEQLWGEDDRLHGRRQFASSGEASWVDEGEDDEGEEKENEEEDSEEEGPKRPIVQQAVLVREQPKGEPETDVDLPLLLHADDHTTTVTLDYKQVQDVFVSLELLTTVTSKSMISAFSDGRLAIALCGHEKSDETIPEKTNAAAIQQPVQSDSDIPSHQTETDDDAAADRSHATRGEDTDEKQALTDGWNVVLKDSCHPTVAFLSGAKTLDALMTAVDWDTANTIAVIQKYSDGKVVVLLIGQQRAKQASQGVAQPTEYASLWGEFFQTVQKSTRHDAFPAQHTKFSSLLQTARRDLVEAGLLDHFMLSSEEHGSAKSSREASISDDATNIAASQGGLSDHEFISVLQERIKETQKALDVARKDVQPSLSHSPSRMCSLLESPTVHHEYFDYTDRHEQKVGTVNLDSDNASTATPARYLKAPDLTSGPTRKTRLTCYCRCCGGSAAGQEPPAASKKRNREASSTPPDLPSPQNGKKRKIAAAVRAKGKCKT